MSRISNLSNLRIPHFNSWKSIWYEDNKYYSLLSFQDFQVHQYFKGLFYRLKMIADDVYFNYVTNDYLYTRANIYIYRFQIKKYFTSIFSAQYFIYNFMFRSNKLSKLFYSSYNWYTYIFDFYNRYILYFLSFNYYYNYNSVVYFRKTHSIISINYKYKYKINPIKFKLKKNIVYFFNFYKLRIKNNSKLLSLFYYISKICLVLSSKLVISFFLYNFFLLIGNKLSYIKYFTIVVSKFYVNRVSSSIYYFFKENYKKELSRDVFDDRNFYDYFTFYFLYMLILNMEKTIYLFTGIKTVFLASFYTYKKLPPLLTSKLISDYVCLELEKGVNLFKIFKNLQFIQLKEKKKLKNELLNNFIKSFFFNYFIKNNSIIKKFFVLFKLLIKKNNNTHINLNRISFFSFFIKSRFLFDLLCQNDVMAKKYPLIGLRIECNGPPKKGRQARLVAYHQIVKNYKLFGKMPNKSILADIDYYQSFARAKQGSIGIKVWMFFYSKTYDSNYKLISIV